MFAAKEGDPVRETITYDVSARDDDDPSIGIYTLDDATTHMTLQLNDRVFRSSKFSMMVKNGPHEDALIASGPVDGFGSDARLTVEIVDPKGEALRDDRLPGEPEAMDFESQLSTGSIGKVGDSAGFSVSETRETSGATPPEFNRGDCNGDGFAGDIADPLALLFFNYLGGVELPCRAACDACDANGDGDASGLGDAFYLLQYMFLAGPVAPFGRGCGPGLLATDRMLDCASRCR